MRRGFTLVEVLVALFLVAVVGSLLLRYLAFSAQAEGSASVRRGLAELARFASWRVASGDPAFLPLPGQQERSYGYGELGSLLAGTGGVNLANPGLYRLRVAAQSSGGYSIEVCYRAPQEECFQVEQVIASQRGGNGDGEPRGALALSVTAPSGLSVVNVRVVGASWSGLVSRPGDYVLSLPPGDYRLEAEVVEMGGVFYRPQPEALAVRVPVSGRVEARLSYTCERGAVRYAVTSGFAATLRGPVSQTLSGSGEAGLPPGEYIVEPQEPPQDYGYQVSVTPPSGRFTLAPCETQEVRVDYAPTKGRLVVEGRVEGYTLEAGAPKASVKPPGSARSQTVELPYTASLDPGTASVKPLIAQIAVDSGGQRYSVTLEPVDPSERQVQVVVAQEAQVSLVYRAVPYRTCLYLYDGMYAGSYFTSGSFRLRVAKDNQPVKDEVFSLTSSCYTFSLPPGVYTLEVERLSDPYGRKGQKSLIASSSSTITSSSVTLSPTRAALRVYVSYDRPSWDRAYDGRGGPVTFTVGGESFVREGSPYGGGNPVLFGVPPRAPLTVSAQNRVFLETRSVSAVDYNYYWRLRGVAPSGGDALPSATPGAGENLTVTVFWALLRCQVAYPDRCQEWRSGFWTRYTP